MRNREGLLKIINIFNGNIYLPKKQLKFKLFLEAYNKCYKTDIAYKVSEFKPSLDNGWFSGFFDAEGCLCPAYRVKSETFKYNRISLRIIVSQQESLETMEELNKLLKGSVSYLKSETYNGYNITVGTKYMVPLIKYLNKFPLKTKKIIQFHEFSIIYEIVKTKHHLTDKGFLQVKDMIDQYRKL